MDDDKLTKEEEEEAKKMKELGEKPLRKNLNKVEEKKVVRKEAKR